MNNSKTTTSTREYSPDDYEQAAQEIRTRTTQRPKVAIVLGSGLGRVADAVINSDIIATEDIPGWPQTTVKRHHGKLIFGEMGGQPVMVQQGRLHHYEGYSLDLVTYPIRVMKQMGIETIVLTNAAGGLDPEFKVGDLMLIEDHINMLGIAGHSPLVGPNDDDLGPRFFGMTDAYDPDLRAIVHKAANAKGIVLKEGVYAGISGPSFETPAEVRMLKMLGASSVGFSTVSETLVARHAGIKVIGISTITNVSIHATKSPQMTVDEEVQQSGSIIVPRAIMLLEALLEQLG